MSDDKNPIEEPLEPETEEESKRPKHGNYDDEPGAPPDPPNG